MIYDIRKLISKVRQQINSLLSLLRTPTHHDLFFADVLHHCQCADLCDLARRVKFAFAVETSTIGYGLR